MFYKIRTRRFFVLALLLCLTLGSNLPLSHSGAAALPPPPAYTVVGWGSNTYGEATLPAGLSGVTAIAAGNMHSLALKSDGTVVGWGNTGLATPPAGLSGVVAIAAGGVHSLALQLQSPQQQATTLVGQVQALVPGTLTQNQADALINKLEQVIDKLDKGQTNAACGQLGSFINQANADINNGSLTAAQGQALINAANAIKTSIGC